MWFIITWTTNPANARGVQVKKKMKKEKNKQSEGANFKVRAEETQNTLGAIEGLQHEELAVCRPVIRIMFLARIEYCSPEKGRIYSPSNVIYILPLVLFPGFATEPRQAPLSDHHTRICMTRTMMMMSGGHANLIRRAIRWIRV